MAEGVGADPLRDAGRLHRCTDGLLHGIFVDVAATHDAAAGIHREPIGGKDVVPDPLTFGIGILACQGIGQIDGAVAPGQVFLVDALDQAQMVLQKGDQALGHYGRPVLLPFAVAHGDGQIVEVQVLDPQADAGHHQGRADRYQRRRWIVALGWKVRRRGD